MQHLQECTIKTQPYKWLFRMVSSVKVKAFLASNRGRVPGKDGGPKENTGGRTRVKWL